MSIQYKSLPSVAPKPSQETIQRKPGIPADPATGAAPNRSLKILLAEDNPVNQDIATRMLERLGHEVELAANGFESVQKAKARLYDMILMDMQMPDMDGLQATRVIRKLPSPHGQIPIVAVTANALPTDRQACLDAGMNDFVSKPVSRDKLAAALEPWAGRQVPGSAASEIAAAAQQPLIDERHFATVARELGDQIFADLLATFWGGIPEAFKELQSVLDRGDPVAADRALHRLKGSAANFGFVGCQAICDEIRAQIQERGLAALDEALPMLLKACRETERLVRRGADA
jgi:two-component system, sensor histidine kinase and response regulator